MKEAAAFIDDYRQFWDESFDRLAEHLRELQEEEKGNDNDERGEE